MRHGDLRESREGRAPSRARSFGLTRVVEVFRTYLTLDEPAQLRASPLTPAGARLVKRHPFPVADYRRLYQEVGEQWYWHDRLEWSDERLAEHLASPDVAVSELLVDEQSAGYFELQKHDDGSVEIVYFGLRPEFIGRGLGAMMLTRAVREAFAMNAARVWLHTCTLDSPRALPSYLARGFRPYRTQKLEVEIEGKEVLAERVLE